MGRFKRVEHLKTSLEVQMINTRSIKADDIFIGKIPTDAIRSKVNYLISNFSPKASGDATFSTILPF